MTFLHISQKVRHQPQLKNLTCVSMEYQSVQIHLDPDTDPDLDLSVHCMLRQRLPSRNKPILSSNDILL